LTEITPRLWWLCSTTAKYSANGARGDGVPGLPETVNAWIDDEPAPLRAVPSRLVDPEAAEEFLALFYAEERHDNGLIGRLRQMRTEIRQTGTYLHTPQELAFGARVAWRNANRCIGRLYWRSLRVRDRRHVSTPAEVAAECVAHLREATNRGSIRPLITVFAPDGRWRRGPRIRNEQLVRYAGYRRPGHVVGDQRNTGITELARELGWRGAGTAFDVLPLVVGDGSGRHEAFPLPADAVFEVEITHPELSWFAELGLRWHAVPAISNLCLEVGGVCYPAAPFNGWYLGTEIGARNFADTDRYDLLPAVAGRLGLDVSTDRSLWRDRALVELNIAVLHSFDKAGVTIADHHTESRRFLTHLDREERHGRPVPADWSWIVPPISGSATPVFHRYYDDSELRPTFAYHEDCR
jgi:nitric-oxide synthase